MPPLQSTEGLPSTTTSAATVTATVNSTTLSTPTTPKTSSMSTTTPTISTTTTYERITKTTSAETTTTPEMSSTDTTTRAPETSTTSEASTLHPMAGCRDQTCPSDGLFPGPELCSPDFCHCSWGVPHPKVCRQGLVFNPSVGVCDWQWNTEDCSFTK